MERLAYVGFISLMLTAAAAPSAAGGPAVDAQSGPELSVPCCSAAVARSWQGLVAILSNELVRRDYGEQLQRAQRATTMRIDVDVVRRSFDLDGLPVVPSKRSGVTVCLQFDPAAHSGGSDRFPRLKACTPRVRQGYGVDFLVEMQLLVDCEQHHQALVWRSRLLGFSSDLIPRRLPPQPARFDVWLAGRSQADTLRLVEGCFPGWASTFAQRAGVNERSGIVDSSCNPYRAQGPGGGFVPWELSDVAAKRKTRDASQ